MLIFFAAFGFLLMATHPFVTYPLSLRLLKPRRGEAQAASAAPASATLCLCAYREGAVIAAKARNMLAMRDASPIPLELLVYVDGEEDDTAQQLAAFGPAITVVPSPTRHGKSHGMRRLAEMARGEILVFTDANVMIDPGAMAALARHFADPRIGCVCGHLTYGNGAASDTSAVNSAYWRLEEEIKRLESGMGAVMGADGSLFAVRRRLAPAVPDDIIDDFYVSLTILCDGHDVIRAEDVRAREESVVDRGEEYRRKIRIACQSFNVHRLLWPRLRRLPALRLYAYLSHKLLRWFVAPALLAAAACAALGLALLLGAVPAALLLAVAAALGLGALALGIGPARRGYEIWLAFWGTWLGVLRSLRGERFQTWTPAQSIRLPVSAAAEEQRG
jgi:cellulose synthase/poly-beta-1,6-N-acetylglucosamine synthase-like glycosyltransferase